jgi:hypothetical protein
MTHRPYHPLVHDLRKLREELLEPPHPERYKRVYQMPPDLGPRAENVDTVEMAIILLEDALRAKAEAQVRITTLTDCMLISPIFLGEMSLETPFVRCYSPVSWPRPPVSTPNPVRAPCQKEPEAPPPSYGIPLLSLPSEVWHSHLLPLIPGRELASFRCVNKALCAYLAEDVTELPDKLIRADCLRSVLTCFPGLRRLSLGPAVTEGYAWGAWGERDTELHAWMGEHGKRIQVLLTHSFFRCSPVTAALWIQVLRGSHGEDDWEALSGVLLSNQALPLLQAGTLCARVESQRALLMEGEALPHSLTELTLVGVSLEREDSLACVAAALRLPGLRRLCLTKPRQFTTFREKDESPRALAWPALGPSLVEALTIQTRESAPEMPAALLGMVRSGTPLRQLLLRLDYDVRPELPGITEVVMACSGSLEGFALSPQGGRRLAAAGPRRLELLYALATCERLTELELNPAIFPPGCPDVAPRFTNVTRLRIVGNTMLQPGLLLIGVRAGKSAPVVEESGLWAWMAAGSFPSLRELVIEEIDRYPSRNARQQPVYLSHMKVRGHEAAAPLMQEPAFLHIYHVYSC